MTPIAPTPADPLAQARRIDAACCEFEARWKSGGRPQVEEFLAAAAAEDRDRLARELASIDEHYRRKAGNGRPAEPVPDDHADRPAAARPDAATVPLGGVTPAASTPGVPARPSVRVPGFEVIGELARGGMAVVYLARDLRLDRVVALKMILAGFRAGPEELIRARVEARAIAALHHPNIVPLYGLAEVDGQPVLVMELLEGGPLSQAIAARPPSPDEAVRLLEQVARGVHHAHQRGVIHRDLKPGNILLDRDGTPKVADFGLAKLLDGDPQVTQANAIVGTPAYMAPEQARNEPDRVGCATDIHALGCILYELLTGKPPFAGGSASEAIRDVCEREAAPPVRHGARLPRDLETICLKCLRKDPDDRYRTALDLAEDLHRYRRGRPILARPLNRLMRVARWVRRHPAPAALLAVLVVGSGLIAADTIQRRLDVRRRTEQTEASLTRAEELRVAAMNDRRDRSRLAEAEGEAARAELLAESCDAALRARVEALREELRRLRSDLDLMSRIDEIRSHSSVVIPSLFSPFAPEGEYAAAFADAGLPRGHPTESAADRVRSSGHAQDILGALDEWAELRRRAHGPADDTRRWLLAVIDASDPDLTRRKIRQAAHRQEEAGLDLPSDALLAAGLPTPTLCLFAAAVGERRGRRAAERLLCLIHRRHPDDVGVSAFAASWLLNRPQPRDYAGARPYLFAALALGPRQPFVHNNLAAIAYASDELEDALEHIARAIALAPDHSAFHYHAALILDKMGQATEAEQEYRRAARMNPDDVHPFALVNLSSLFSRRGDGATALRLADRAVAADPDCGLAHLRRATVLLEAHRYPDALAALRRAEKGKVGDAALAVNLSHALVKVGLHDEAIRVCRAVLKADETHDKARLNLCAALAEVGREEEAVKELRQLAERQPDYALAHFNLGQALLSLGRFDDARASLRTAHRLGSKQLKWPYPTQKLIDEATRLLERDPTLADVLAGKRSPERGSEWLDLARCSVGRKDYPAAVRCFRAAFRVTPALAADLDEEYRLQAVVAACRAAEVEGRKGEAGRDAARAFREQALAWLRDELAAMVELLRDSNPQLRTAVLRHLQVWKQHRGLAALRDTTGYAAEERRTVEAFWKSVDEVITTKLGGK